MLYFFIVLFFIIIYKMSQKESEISNEALRIDVEKIISNKNPKLLRIIPRFLINYLKRIIHQDEVNEFLANNSDKFGLDFSQAIIDNFSVNHDYIGLDNVPEDGRYIFAANHPLGGMDGIVFLTVVGRKFPNIKFPVNDILTYLRHLNNIFLPINKHGGHSKEAFQAIEDAYESDNQMLMFPAGMVSRKIKGEITDLEWKRSFIKKSIQHKRDIVPVFITGQNTNFFYNLAKWRGRLGIKANLEMLFLSDELFKQRGKTVSLKFGKPIPWQTFTKEKTYDEWANDVKKVVYSL